MYILDRIEDGVAVIEAENEVLYFPMEQLPSEAKEGDVLLMTEGCILIDTESTNSRKAALRSRLNGLFEK